jgi:hypothetical protein
LNATIAQAADDKLSLRTTYTTPFATTGDQYQAATVSACQTLAPVRALTAGAKAPASETAAKH